jgi:glycosyltransferase involved in cell wall biosynthesis
MTSVSVVIPTRNRWQLLPTTLHSVLWQLDVDLEVIVVDEASTDRTAAFLSDIADGRVRSIRHDEPRGPGGARNHGAAAARGEWVAFVDDDDVWAPEKLAQQLAAAAASRRDWAYAGVLSIGTDLQPICTVEPPSPADVVSGIAKYNLLPGGGSNVVVRRQLFAEAGGFDARLPPCEDWELWIRFARSGPPALAPEPLVGYRVHAGNASLDTARVLRACRLIEQLHGVAIDWGRLYRWLAESCLRMDRHASALAYLAKAAAWGQGRHVASDLASIVRRRMARAAPAAADMPDGHRQKRLIKEAAWLEPLRDCEARRFSAS